MTTDLTLTDTSRFDDKFDRVLRWCRDDRADNDPARVKIPAELEQSFHRWNQVYGLINTGRYARTKDKLNAIIKAMPGTSPRMARILLADTQRFFSVLDAPNLAWERTALIDELQDTMRLAKRKGDLRSYAALAKLYSEVIGADKAETPAENKTVINIINYNPVHLGAQVMDEGKLNDLIRRITASDKKKAETLFDDFEDVSAP